MRAVVVDYCGLSFRLREIYDIYACLIEASIEGDCEWTKMKTWYDVELMLVVGRFAPLCWRGLLASFDESVCLILNARKE